MTLTFRTLLSGGELFGVGARAAGYAHIDGYELDPKIAAVARRNGFDVRAADICDIDYSTLPPADHLHASPVCTRASAANVGAEESDADRAMADAVCRAIAAHQGRTVSLENVWAYRTFESFARILTALLDAGFVYDFAHVNAADYGVPQTRKRLILRAVRGPGRVPPLIPTHRKGGDMFSLPWVGWYAAIADILHTLPATQPAPWQLARMPKELRESMSNDNQNRIRAFLIGAGGWDGNLVQADETDPAFTMTATDNSQQIRALLLNDQSKSAGTGIQLLEADEPASTVRTFSGGAAPRAYIVGGGNTQLTQIDSHACAGDEPMFTVSAGDGAKKSAAAYLLSGENAGSEWGNGYRERDDPAFVVGSSAKGAHRAYAGGRWVRMTVQALGRFQSVPDSYVGLTPQINGNGVPSLLARRIMESLRSVYA